MSGLSRKNREEKVNIEMQRVTRKCSQEVLP